MTTKTVSRAKYVLTEYVQRKIPGEYTIDGKDAFVTDRQSVDEVWRP